jgi:Arc/MetJ family transcription regulator
MRTTIVINEDLLREAMKISGTTTKKETVEKALKELILRKKRSRLIELEGKIALSFTLDEFTRKRREDVPHR